MIFKKTELKDAYIIELEKHEDNRGFFARTWCLREFETHSIAVRPPVQSSISFNKKRGTLRGMHIQAPPHSENKLVRCVRGAIYDVIIDLRLGSPTFKKWMSVELTAENDRMLFIPIGMAHGFQTLKNSTEVFYLMDEYYHPESARRIAWNDPELGIVWPLKKPILSSADRQASSSGA